MLVFMIMAYSTDLRKRVLYFINNGGSKVAAERTFGVSRRTIYNWLEAEDPSPVKSRDLKDPDTLITMRFANMSMIFPIAPLTNAPSTSVFPNTVSFMPCQNSISREKKDADLQRAVPRKTPRVSLSS